MTRPLFLRRLDPAVKAALLAEAERREASLNDVAVGALAEAYKLSFEPKGGRAKAGTAAATVTLRVPEALWRKVHVSAMGRSIPVWSEVERVLADRYQLRWQPPARRPGRRAAARLAAPRGAVRAPS